MTRRMRVWWNASLGRLRSSTKRPSKSFSWSVRLARSNCRPVGVGPSERSPRRSTSAAAGRSDRSPRARCQKTRTRRDRQQRRGDPLGRRLEQLLRCEQHLACCASRTARRCWRGRSSPRARGRRAADVDAPLSQGPQRDLVEHHDAVLAGSRDGARSRSPSCPAWTLRGSCLTTQSLVSAPRRPLRRALHS